MKERIERALRSVFGAHAHEPDPERMTGFERRQAAEAMQPTGAGLSDEIADESQAAEREARGATIRHPPVSDETVDESHVARWQSRSASEESGADLESEPVDDSDRALWGAAQANPHEAPRDTLADESETAREDARRANRPPEA